MKTMKTRMKGLLLLALLIPALSVHAQENEPVKQERTVENFTRIVYELPCKLMILQSDAPALWIEGPKETIDRISASVKDGSLRFENKAENLDGVTIYASAKNLEALEASGAADIKSGSRLKSDALQLDIDGAANVGLELEVGGLVTELSGAAHLELEGIANSHTVEVDGAAILDAQKLRTEKTQIDVSGAASANVDATQTLSGEISGVAQLRNMSQATNTNIEKSGAATFGNDTTATGNCDRNYEMKGDFPPHKGPLGKFSHQRKKVNPQWMGLELGFNSYVNRDFSFNLADGRDYLEPIAGRSMNIGLNIFEIGVPLVKRHLTLVTGLGFEFNNYYYRNNYALLADTTQLTALQLPGADYDKNKLSVSYIRVPLLLQFDTKRFKHDATFHVSLGVIGALRMCSHTRQTWEIDDTRYRAVTHDDFNLSPFKADATFRIGYGYLNLFVNYSLNSMFRKDEGPQLFPVSAGITLVNI